MDTIKAAYYIFIKDMKCKFKTRYAISSMVLFVLTSVIVILFALSNEQVEPGTISGMFWVVMFFGSMTGLSRSFVSEEKRGTSFLLHISARSSSVYFGKLMFNIILSLSLNIFAAILFLIFFNNIKLNQPLAFLALVILGSLGLAGASTLISAIISKANTKGALMPILSFPVLLPLIMAGTEICTTLFLGGSKGPDMNSYRLIVAYCGILVIVSYFLFDFVWKE